MLYPAPVRDLLIEVACTGLYRARWTKEIEEEWISNLLENRPDISRQKLNRTCELMREAVLGSIVTGYEHLVASIALPDENDRHVLAAAVHAGAGAIVTYNLRDFPKTECAKYNIEPLHPDEFLHHQLGLDDAAVITSAQRVRSRLRRPQISPIEYLGLLRQNGLIITASELEPFAQIL